METTHSIQIFFNFPKIYRIDNDDLEYGSILKPGNYNITTYTGINTTFSCVLAPGQEIESILYNGNNVQYTTVNQVVHFVLDPGEEGVQGELSIVAKSSVNGCEVYDLNNLQLSDGPNTIAARLRNHAFLDSVSSPSVTYDNITTLQGTT